MAALELVELTRPLMTPPGLYGLLFVGLVLMTRMRTLWGNTGLIVLLAVTFSGAVVVLAEPTLRQVALAENRPMAFVIGLGTALGLWSLLDDERRRRLLTPKGAQVYFPARKSSGVRPARRELFVSALLILLAGCLAVWAERPLPHLGNLAETPLVATIPAASGELVTWPWFLAPLIFWREVLGPSIGPSFPLLALALLVALPWLDPEDPEDGGRHRLVTVIFAAVFGLVLVPMVLVILRVPLAASLPLSAGFWEHWLGRPAPRPLMLRELPGLVLLAACFVFPILVFPRWRASRGLARAYRRRFGALRFGLAMVVVTLLVLPVVLLLSREILGLGPWLDLPEWGLRL